MKKAITIKLLSIIILLLSGCFVTDEGFHSLIDITINNQTSYNVTFFTKRIGENEEHNYSSHGPVASQTSKAFTRPSGYTYDMYCVSGDNIWGPDVVYIDFGKDYTWTISDPATPTPSPVPTLTPAPTGVILINNNSLDNVDITISSDSKGILNAGTSITYSELPGEYNLFAGAVDSEKFWEINISLTEEGYEWNLEENLEVFPSENHRIWNFENNYDDHLGVDGWDYHPAYSFSSTVVKFGISSFSGSFLESNLFAIPVNELTTAGWVYVENFPSSEKRIFGLIIRYGLYASVPCFQVKLTHTGTVYMEYNPDYTTEFMYVIESHVITPNEWHYISVSFDTSKPKTYLTVDNYLYAGYSCRTWYTSLNTYAIYTDSNFPNIDEFIIVEEYINPNVFIQHFNRNLPWNIE